MSRRCDKCTRDKAETDRVLGDLGPWVEKGKPLDTFETSSIITMFVGAVLNVREGHDVVAGYLSRLRDEIDRRIPNE